MPVRVLIAEDEWVIAFATRRQVEACGHQVVGVVATGEAAIEAACAQGPDVVFMDIQMPGIDGISATRKLMELCPHAVVIVTGYATYRDEAERAGAVDFVLKPLDTGQVPRIIETALQRFARFRVVQESHPARDEALAAWLTVERAVRALAKGDSRTEPDAFAQLQRMAAERQAGLETVAQGVLAA